MGWKTRGGRAYYYQSERIGDRVVTNYINVGIAGLLSRLDSLDREKRRCRRYLDRGEAEESGWHAEQVGLACRLLTTAAGSVLERAGYHRHDRGPWRRRRAMSDAATLERIAKTSGREETQQKLNSLVARADKGDVAAGDELDALIRECPTGLAEKMMIGLARIAENAMIDRCVGKGKLGQAAFMRADIGRVRDSVAGPSPSAVERLLAERVALCWLDYHYQEITCVRRNGGDETIRQADLSSRQRDRAHRRYLAALKALASVRKIPIVAVQVNVGTDAQAVQGA